MRPLSPRSRRSGSTNSPARPMASPSAWRATAWPRSSRRARSQSASPAFPRRPSAPGAPRLRLAAIRAPGRCRRSAGGAARWVSAWQGRSEGQSADTGGYRHPWQHSGLFATTLSGPGGERPLPRVAPARRGPERGIQTRLPGGARRHSHAAIPGHRRSLGRVRSAGVVWGAGCGAVMRSSCAAAASISWRIPGMG